MLPGRIEVPPLISAAGRRLSSLVYFSLTASLVGCGHATSLADRTRDIPQRDQATLRAVAQAVARELSPENAREAARALGEKLPAGALDPELQGAIPEIVETMISQGMATEVPPSTARALAEAVEKEVSQKAARALDMAGSGLASSGPNVILISIDTTRADAVSAYGKNAQRYTPNIDELARRGVLFENTFANSFFTPTSHMSMLTGLYPSSHRVLDPYDLSKNALRPHLKTLAQILHGHGYRTAAFAQAFPMLNPNLGFGRGFDEFHDAEFVQDDLANPRVARWIRENREKSFFLFLHSWAPHSPYLTPYPFSLRWRPQGYEGKLTFDMDQFYEMQHGFNYAKTLGKGEEESRRRIFGNDFWKNMFLTDGMNEAYWSMVRTDRHLAEDATFLRGAYQSSLYFVDLMIGRLLKSLADAGLARNTIIVVTSDHGEEFLEHGNFFHQTSYNEILRVPLVIFDPRDPRHAGRRVAQNVQSVDIVPTVLSLLDLEEPAIFDGRSLLPLMRQENAPLLHPFVFSYTALGGVMASCQSREWKLLYREGKGLELFDLRNDPGEQRPIRERARFPREAKELQSRLSQLIGKRVD